MVLLRLWQGVGGNALRVPLVRVVSTLHMLLWFLVGFRVLGSQAVEPLEAVASLGSGRLGISLRLLLSLSWFVSVGRLLMWSRLWTCCCGASSLVARSRW